MNQKIVLSGMRPTGELHLGHYYGALKNWVDLQKDHKCFFMVADLHALTTHYQDSQIIDDNILDMVIDWMVCGLSPEKSTIFIQSLVPEHAQLYLALAMITPLSWLERVPTYKEQQENLVDRDLSTYGFLGYPLLQAADILIYNAEYVPVGEDQSSHVELTREIARRFNSIFGISADFNNQIKSIQEKIHQEFQNVNLEELKIRYQQQGSTQAFEKANSIIENSQKLSKDEKLIAKGDLRGSGKMILTEPQVLLTEEAKLPGLDGQKMSKSYNNSLSLRESDQQISHKIKTMKTDPQRMRLTDAGDPKKCPVWSFHKIYSDQKTCDWVWQGCTNAEFGCLKCKEPVIESVISFITPLRTQAHQLVKDKEQIRNILIQGSQKARETAHQVLDSVHSAMGVLNN